VENLWKNGTKPEETPRKDGTWQEQKGEDKSNTPSALPEAAMCQITDNKQFI
jgi:hypothetical protein